MKITAQHITRARLALLLLVVFGSSFMFKPVHLLFAHHERQAPTRFHPNEQMLETERHNDCAICEYEFCTFIPEKTTNTPQINAIICDCPTPPTTDKPISRSLLNFQLRAPPVC